MSKLHIVIEEAPPMRKVLVFAKERLIVPFIGVMERADGSRERGVGVKCPDQEKMVFRAINSNNPLHYAQAFKMLGEIQEINDGLVQDCIIATQGNGWIQDLVQTEVYKKRGAYRQSMLRKAQIKALEFSPGENFLKQVTDGFSTHGAPFAKKNFADLSLGAEMPSCSVIHLARPNVPIAAQACASSLVPIPKFGAPATISAS
ncbi:MAG: hypothetical protein ACYCZ7_01920 [Minisyncoccota bacterium]